jgi:hypothetical protein
MTKEKYLKEEDVKFLRELLVCSWSAQGNNVDASFKRHVVRYRPYFYTWLLDFS